MASIPTVVHEPAATIATTHASVSAPRSAVGTTVASVPTAVHEHALAVATADASTVMPRSAVGTAAASVLTVVHESVAAVAIADVFQHLATSLLLLWQAQAPRCTSLRSHMFTLQYPTALLRLLRAQPPLRSRSSSRPSGDAARRRQCH